MLKDLYIENVAVAKRLEINFSPGFSVITGETGAGKSVTVDCLYSLTGSKMNRDSIRSGEERATVTGLFSDASRFTNGFLDDDCDELLISRSVTTDSRSSVRANGMPITLSLLKNVSRNLIALTSQGETQFLMNRDEYVGLLDSYASDEREMTEYRGIFDLLTSKKSELRELKSGLKDKEMLSDILSYQIREIDSMKITSEKEAEKYIRLRDKIKNYEKLSKSAALIDKALSTDTGGAAYLIERASSAISKLGDVLPDASELVTKLEDIRYTLLDVSDRVSDSLSFDDVSDPDAQLNIIEAKLSHIEKLKRKYGNTVEEIIAFKKEAENKLDSLNQGDEIATKLKKEILQIERKARDVAGKLTDARKSAAVRLSSEITDTLKELDMPKVRFSVSVRPFDDGRLASTGADYVDMLISVNPGEPMMSLSKVASGGELSRIMLALKCSVNENAGASTLVFDEIDTGVSGSTSERIGIMMKELSKRVQVIAVTHSPQLASLADHHILIKKDEVEGRSESSAKEISGEDRVLEIARIIGGIEITEKQKAAAREMLAKAGSI